MARVELSSQAWGWVTDPGGNGLAGASVTLKNLDGTNATHWSAITGGTSSTLALTTNSDGTLPRFIEGGAYTMTVAGVTRRVDAVPGSVGASKFRTSVATTAAPDGYTDAETDLDVNLTTPESLQILAARYDDLDRLVSPNPGVYNWGSGAYEVNLGTAPVTAVFARARGNTVYTVSSSGRAYGAAPEIHGFEITVGLFASVATVTTTIGSNVLTNVAVTQDGKGSRFENGMAISGTGIPVGTTIINVTGRPGSPTSIALSANATASASGVTVTAQPGSTSTESIGMLVTGNGGTADGGGNPTGIAIQIQAQNTDSGFYRGLSMGASSLRPDGIGVRLFSHTADVGISMESANYTNALKLSGVTTTGSVISFSTVTGTIGLNFASSNSFSTAAIVLAGQDIATDTTTGMKIATVSTQKIGFYGKTPIVRPSLAVAATDAATTQTLANSLRSALINLGLGA